MTRHYSSAIDRARALEDHERHDPGDRYVEADLCCVGCCATPATAGKGRPVVATHTLDRTEAGNDYWRCATCGAVTIRTARRRAEVLPLTGEDVREAGVVEPVVMAIGGHENNMRSPDGGDHASPCADLTHADARGAS